jgi:excisionase family DNA binding protein
MENAMNSAKCDLLSPRQLAMQTGWPERRIRRLIEQNQIRHIRVGPSVLLPATAIEEFVRTHMVTPDQTLLKVVQNG